MKRLITILFVLASAIGWGQSNQIDVKKAVVRNWIIYQGDTLTNVRIESDTLFATKGSTLDTFYLTNYWSQTADSLYPADWSTVNVGIGTNAPDETFDVRGNAKHEGGTHYWRSTDEKLLMQITANATRIDPASEIRFYDWVYADTGFFFNDSVYFQVDAVPYMGTGDTIPGLLTLKKIGTGTQRQLAITSFDDIADSLGSPQYWTFIDSATDTLKNNVATAGVVAVKGNLELQTTNAAATQGVVKQNGVNLIHTYHEKGDNNLFLGQGAGNFTADSSFNIGIGISTLNGLTTGSYNIAIGLLAGTGITTQKFNTIIGNNAGRSGDFTCNTFIGSEAGENANNATGNNTFIGYQSGEANTSTYNVAVGSGSLSDNTGSSNTAIGTSAMSGAGTGSGNTAIGYSALGDNMNGSYNIAIGDNSLIGNRGNNYSVAIGRYAMRYADSRTSGRTTYNTAIGVECMRGSSTAANNTGTNNTATGYQSLDAMTTASFNTIYGYDAGGGITTGDSNIFIGTSAGSALTTESDLLYIDNTNTSTPLIWGNMRTDSLRWNGNVAFVHDLWYEDTYWRDATTSATALAPGVNAPSQRTIIGGINGMGYAPSTQNDISYGQVQLNHDYKFDTDIHAHMHFMIEEAGEAGDTAVFALEYSWADIDETFPISDTLTILIPCAAITAKQHKLVEFGDITGSGGNFVSSSIIFRLERLQDSDHDTYDGANEYVIVLDIDYHIEIDAPGSRGETSK